MSQKINQTLFRLSDNYIKSSWLGSNKSYLNLAYQDWEMKRFLSNLFEENGVFLCQVKITRAKNDMKIGLNLYFSQIFHKRLKKEKAKNFASRVKSKYQKFSKIKTLRRFYKFFLNYGYLKRNEDFYLGTKKNILDESSGKISSFKAFRFLTEKKKKDNFKLCGVKPDKKALHISKQVSSSKSLKTLFNYRKFGKESFPLGKKKSLKKKELTSLKNRRKSPIFYSLCRKLAKSLQNFVGVEKLSLELSSSQLRYFPFLRFFRRKVMRGNYRFRRRETFYECLELAYFILVNFSKTNSKLLGKFIVYLLESSRRQSSNYYFFTSIISKLLVVLPKEWVAIKGIRIVVKGRFNKRRRTKKIVFQEGTVLTSTLASSLSYYQTKAVTIYGAFGVKVWVSGKYSWKSC